MTADVAALREAIESLWARHEAGDLDADAAGPAERSTLDDVLDGLEAGEVAAASPVDGGASDNAAGWRANEWVKRGILLNFALRPIEAREHGGVVYNDVLPLAETDGYGDRGTRNTPDGTVVRRGAHVGDDAILMSPSFVNVGASLGDGTLVDSAVTVGSAAQVGDGVKIGANTLVGGVLEPVEDAPVVLEDDVTLGAGCRVTSGFVVGEGSVVAENTLLTPRIPVYDLVEERVLYGHLPPERRAFTRFVASSVGDHDLFDGGAYKPAVVAMDLTASTLDGAAREEVLRE
ncbi:MAG: 2,3,4,5-tetrahydropyridine-2,6-dicarboxylate N-succinyltransferase [Halobacteriales archaeon]